MTILVDTDWIVAFLHAGDGRHADAQKVAPEVFGGWWGASVITDYVLDEALTLLMARGAPLVVADQLVGLVAEPSDRAHAPHLVLHRIDQEVFWRAMFLFRRHFARRLSFTDCTTLAMAEMKHVNFVASFDHGFDGLVVRIEA